MTEARMQQETGAPRRTLLVRLTGTAVIVLLVVVVLELGAFFYTTYLARYYGILFFVPHITEDYATYASRLHPLLGWPSPQALKSREQEIAQEKAGFAPTPGKGGGAAAISAYGDSFTAGFGVAPEHTWSRVLGAKLGRHIANYGVPGYGTDQAYLRFQANSQDPAKIVLLGYLSENIQRNVNQLRNFLIPSRQCQIKPRFLLDEAGRLRFLPPAALTGENYLAFINHPERFLHHDYFIPGGPSGAQRLKFPYTWSILRAYRFFYNRWILGYKSYLQFYRPEHPSGAFPLTVAILKEWCAAARARGQHPIVLIFPTNEDIRLYQQQQQWVYEPLLKELSKEGIEYIDLGTEMSRRLGQRHYLEFFSGGKYLHFNIEGNRLVAQILYDYFITHQY
ncbi:MAG: hypothetical protein ACUVXF_10075 [Desulfobaccales bacterium]